MPDQVLGRCIHPMHPSKLTQRLNWVYQFDILSNNRIPITVYPVSVIIFGGCLVVGRVPGQCCPVASRKSTRLALARVERRCLISVGCMIVFSTKASVFELNKANFLS